MFVISHGASEIILRKRYIFLRQNQLSVRSSEHATCVLACVKLSRGLGRCVNVDRSLVVVVSFEIEGQYRSQPFFLL